MIGALRLGVECADPDLKRDELMGDRRDLVLEHIRQVGGIRRAPRPRGGRRNRSTNGKRRRCAGCRRGAGIDAVDGAVAADFAEQRIRFLRCRVEVCDRVAQLRLGLRVVRDLAQIARDAGEGLRGLGDPARRIEQVLAQLRVLREVVDLIGRVVERVGRKIELVEQRADLAAVVGDDRIHPTGDVDDVGTAGVDGQRQRALERVEPLREPLRLLVRRHGDVVGVRERRLERVEELRFARLQVGEQRAELVDLPLAFLQQVAQRRRVGAYRLLRTRKNLARQQRDGARRRTRGDDSAG